MTHTARFKDNSVGFAKLMRDISQEHNFEVANFTLIYSTVMYIPDLKHVESFVKHTYPYWGYIHDRNEEFFLTHSGSLFTPHVSPEKIKTIQSFFVTVVSKDDKDLMWEYLISMVKIALKHISETRKTDPSYLSSVNVKSWSQKYGVVC